MKKRYVYYNKVGMITDILDKRKKGRSPYIECSIDQVIGFLDNSVNINYYIIAYDKITDKNVLMEKNNVIKVRKPSKILYKIPYKKNDETDIELICYPENTLEVSLDPCRIAPLYQTNFRDEVRFERGTEIRIVIKEKGSGKLLKELIIEAQELLESSQIFHDLPDLNNVEFFTYSLFDSYSWKKRTVRLISPISQKIKFEINKADHKRKSKDFDYHLVMKPTTPGLEIKNNIKSLKTIKFNEHIEFFVVDKHDPHILYEKFFLDKEDLSKQKIIVNLKTDLKRKTILYNNKYIGVLLDE